VGALFEGRHGGLPLPEKDVGNAQLDGKRVTAG